MRSSLNLNSGDKFLSAWNALRAENPRIRTREAARELHCSEADLVGAGAGGEADLLDARRDHAALLESLVETGVLMWMVRNDGAVLEVDAAPTVTEESGILLLQAPNLRAELQTSAIGPVFFVKGESRVPRSVQFYGRQGQALLKVFLKDSRRAEQLDSWASIWRAAPGSRVELEASHAPSIAAVTAGERTARDSYRRLLEASASHGEFARLRVSNSACSLEVLETPKRLLPHGPWFNVLDEDLNLHLNEELVHSAIRALAIVHGEQPFVFLDSEGAELLRISLPVDSAALNQFDQ